MSVIEKSLLPGERMVMSARLSPLPLVTEWLIVLGGLVIAGAGFALLVPLMFGGWALMAVGAFIALLGLGRLVRTLIQRATTEMVVTDKRILTRTGVLRKEVEEMFLNKVESVEVKQSLMARMLNTGTVLVHGSGEGLLEFYNVASPAAFRQACLAAVEQSSRPGGGVVAPSGPVFEVEVTDGPGGTARWVEVRAPNAEQARQLAAGTGVKVGEARLKRIG